MTRRASHRTTDHASRITDHGSRITHHGSRITHNASPNTQHATRNTPHATRLARVALVAVSLLLPASPRAEIVNRIVATIDGEPVTLYEIKQFVLQRTGGVIPPGLSLEDPQLLEPYLTERIIKKEIADLGITISDAEIDKQIERIRAQNQLTPERFEQAVQAQGMTLESFRAKLREEMEKAQLINREIRGKVNVTPEEVERYYEAHRDEYSAPEEVHLRHIVLRLEPNASPSEVATATEKAAELRRRIEDGEDFAELAKQYSEDAAAESGGDLGLIGRGEMLDEFEAAVSTLKVGEVSQPVRTAAGVHLIKLEAAPGTPESAKEALAGEIKEQLYNAALEERYQRWLAEDLRKRHHVEMRP
jgi:peptidyl-prolyl cis-trans isomerase SurA